VDVKHLDAIASIRQELVMVRAEVPGTAQVALKSIEDRGHPWRGTRLTRMDWARNFEATPLSEDRDIDILYWVGCTGALESKTVRATQATFKLLRMAGIKVVVLGYEERCCGEPARRLGNEYLFQTQAEQNIALLRKYSVRKIVTACPHCYHVFKNEYPVAGGELEIMHHTQFIAHLLKEGRLKVSRGEGKRLTYHDPCYLGHHNGVYEPPRQILQSIPDSIFVEMKLNREQGFCCGGGGGHMWLEERDGRRISEMRAEEAASTGSQTLVTACPFCFQMFEDALKEKGLAEKLRVLDIAEMVMESVAPDVP
jgi:Fe-S oxidoreductase